MSIHLIIFIVQFEPAYEAPDPFGCTDDKKPPPVRTKNDEIFEYEIERLVKNRLIKN